MSGQRQRVSRAESQQRTREELLDAAEELFLANGLGGTTVTKIADAAGRTVGAIYSNFSSKENLCAEVLLRCYMRTFSEVAGRLIQSAWSVDEQITELARWSASLGGDEGLVALAAEYALVIHKDQAQLAVSQGHIAMGRGCSGRYSRTHFRRTYPRTTATRHSPRSWRPRRDCRSDAPWELSTNSSTSTY
ncbi:bacterial regulatory s, tetR family protein [Mycobacteroides abscessus subsp. bolletii 1513]|uniref:Bacterial regulatory s, tetR family protein n=1 Tax=Mycobacteroides abscessus subsp. bolletii 1513 TaxID=1299321 RepID=X8DE48_9MYCO|nr:bacterial regulatory s, tetR family protein [Mycobacteroides abscessus subsp. bolletii 1513]